MGLRVAVLAPISWRTPPRHYGPWELFASLLTEGLVGRGHDVTLFATGDSRTAANLCSVIPRGWSDDPSIDPKVAECLHISAVFERADEFDVIHNSFDFLPADLQRPRGHSRGDDDPRILLGQDPPRLREVQRHAVRTSPSATPIGTPDSTTPRPSTTASTPTHSDSTRDPTAICCSSDEFIPTKERLTPSTLLAASGCRY